MKQSSFPRLLPSSGKKRLQLGLFGGTFNPVHNGHLTMAQDALEQIPLDLIIFIPCAQSPHKKTQLAAPARDRLAMLNAAVKKFPHFWVTQCELIRPAPSYAIETVEDLSAAFTNANFFWLIGQDQFPKLRTWERYEELKKRVHFIAAARNITSSKKPKEISFLLPRRIDISSSEIRRRVEAGQAINAFVPPAVASYIQRHRLYQSASS